MITSYIPGIFKVVKLCFRSFFFFFFFNLYFTHYDVTDVMLIKSHFYKILMINLHVA